MQVMEFSYEACNPKVCHNDFKGVWSEIINAKSKNVICGCIYHPRANLYDFTGCRIRRIFVLILLLVPIYCLTGGLREHLGYHHSVTPSEINGQW